MTDRSQRTREELIREAEELEGTVAYLKGEIADGEETISGLEQQKDSGDLEEAINGVLDCAERPVGTLNATLPQTPASERALMHLYTAAGRNI